MTFSFSDGIGAFVIRLSQISAFFSYGKIYTTIITVKLLDGDLISKL